jgi:hypothetical protein
MLHFWAVIGEPCSASRYLRTPAFAKECLRDPGDCGQSLKVSKTGSVKLTTSAHLSARSVGRAGLRKPDVRLIFIDRRKQCSQEPEHRRARSRNIDPMITARNQWCRTRGPFVERIWLGGQGVAQTFGLICCIPRIVLAASLGIQGENENIPSLPEFMKENTNTTWLLAGT